MQFTIPMIGEKVSLVNVIIIFVLAGLVWCHAICSCSKVSVKEGLQLIGASVDYKMGTGVPQSWEKNTTPYTPDKWFSNLNGNVGGKVPLPPGELFYWYQNKSHPDCCPATYSNSMGCICASPEQAEYLNERGGNRTFSTEY